MSFYRINVTSACNLSCKYCHTNSYFKKLFLMNFSTLDFSINEILKLKHFDGPCEVTFSIYGGEPFLNKINLFRAIEKYGNLFDGIKINWIINTNGTLVDEGDLKFLKTFNVDLHVSIDGPEGIHNITRMDKKSGPSFFKAKKTIENALKEHLPVQINSYVTPENLYFLKDLVDLSFELGVKRIYLDWFYSDKFSLDNLAVINEYIKALKYAELKGINISGPWTKILNNYLNGRAKDLSCASNLNAIEVTPDGRFFFSFFPLTRKKPFKISRLNEILNSEKAEKFLRACLNYFKKRCSGCWLENYCFGSAIVQYHYHTNNDNGSLNICDIMKKMLSNLIPRSNESGDLKTLQVNITYECNRNCGYCYVDNFMSSKKVMGLADFCSMLDWLEKKGISNINITGGEPTLHPNFRTMVELANQMGFTINLFSNFVFSSSIYEVIEKIDGFLVSINEEKFYSKEELELLQYNLMNISSSKKVTIMFCVDKHIRSCEHVINICKKYNIDKVLIDVTHPNSMHSNNYVGNEEIMELKNKLMYFVREFALNFIRVEFSKPLPYCIFSKDEFKYVALGHRFRGICSAGSEILSVNPDLRVFPCLQLFIKGPKITEFNSVEEYKRFYRICIKELKWNRFLFEQCKNCLHYKEKKCQGSCLCRKVKGFKVFESEGFILYSQYSNTDNYVFQIEKSMNYLDKWFGEIRNLKFFQFDNKKDLRLYSNTYKFPRWVRGFSSENIYYQTGFVKDEKIFVHELCHLYIGAIANNNLPNWFNEGLCEFMAFGDEVHKKFKNLRRVKNPISFINMSGTYSTSLLKFDADIPKKNIAYQQSASLVGFMIEKFGFDFILELIRANDFYDELKLRKGMLFNDLINEWSLFIESYSY